MLSAAVILATGGGLLAAAPSVAATTGLPSGCTAAVFTNPAEVTSIACPALADGARFSAFTNLTSWTSAGRARSHRP